MKRRFLLAMICGLGVFACSQAQEGSDSPANAETTADVLGNPKVEISTNMGTIILQLDSEKAPITVANFVAYVEKGHYADTIFHRVIDGFMIQGGGFQMTEGGPTEKASGEGIKNEGQNGLKNDKYTVAMARTNDPDSATAQFFINVANNAALNYPSNGGYAVFGKVIEGQEVVDKIGKVETQRGNLRMLHPQTGDHIVAPAGDVPVEAVVIESMRVLN